MSSVVLRFLLLALLVACSVSASPLIFFPDVGISIDDHERDSVQAEDRAPVVYPRRLVAIKRFSDGDTTPPWKRTDLEAFRRQSAKIYNRNRCFYSPVSC